MPEQQSRNVEAKSDEITSEANDLLSAMGFDTISFESLLKISGLTSEALSSMLMVLELDSKVTTLAA
ncbi:MAG: DNA processing protein [Methylophilaceae bacterium]